VATVLSAALGADQLAGRLGPVFADWGMESRRAGPLAFVTVTLATSYVSLVLGELVPKRLGRQRAEGLSLLAAPLLDFIAMLSRPVIWLLSVSTNGVVRLLGGNPSTDRAAMTIEELREMVTGHQELAQDERKLIGEVFAA